MPRQSRWHQPARVGVGNQFVARLHDLGYGTNTFDIDIRVAADLELKTAITLITIPANVGGHFVR